MSTVEEVTAQILEKGEQIRILKAEKPVTLKTDLEPLISSLLELKISYKKLSGEEYDKPKEEKKKVAVVVEREGPSKTELNKLKRKEQRAEKRAEGKGTIDEVETVNVSKVVETVNDEENSHLFGDYPIIQSTQMTDKNYRRIEELTAVHAGQTIWVRGRVANSRAVGKGIFLVLRQSIDTVQAVIFTGPTISKSFVKYASNISLESIIDIQAVVTIPDVPITSTTQKNIELQVTEIHIVSKSYDLPFLVDDAGRNATEAIEKQLPQVNQDTSLMYRWIDTRTPANQSIFRIQSGVCQLFREFFISRNFIEIHTPKLIGGASEGGSNVFTLQYFDQPACLAQSPQLYKQMVAACGGFERFVIFSDLLKSISYNL